MTNATLQITNRRNLFAGISFEDVLRVDIGEARAVWTALGGPAKNFKLISEPGASTKTRKSVLPEYILYLLPHRLANQLQDSYLTPYVVEALNALGYNIGRININLCPWSTAGCRKNCLVHAGRGKSTAVVDGRMRKTLLATYFPAMFLALMRDDLQRIERTNPDAWVRLNGTSDITWESNAVTYAMLAESNLQFGDYTKASPSQRPDPVGISYRLARSAWPGRQTPRDILNLRESGHSVSVVVDDSRPLDGIEGFVNADKTDEWLLSSTPVIGYLTAKGSLRRDPNQVYRSQDLL